MEGIIVSFTIYGAILAAIILALSVSLVICLIKYNEALKNSVIDSLTGLFNTRYLHQRLREEISRASRYGHSLYLLFIDLDRFKEVNDTFGHGEGDEVLKEAAKALKKVMRPYDIVVRNGGDEFVILTAEMAWEDINNIAERLRLDLKKISTSKCVGTVTASIGLHPINISKPEDDALKAADAAMYEAKRLGGDRVCLSPEFQKEKTVR
jgi:diguanylate cyclase (GGDEF)-like protein